ncbi:terminase small subunit [Acinetobacter gerneri]|uniref:terminase small subunit n=1 Tax=Acinetobacter gerneri TaxID=202952 RepID=UPI002935AC3B|nr:terminase small subunit [Acinetobacter gerneri]MDV2439952.1 terminase small subunit [Acinetobacter gerneri]
MTDMQKGQIVSRQGLSEVFGVAKTTIDAWVKRGCPVVVRSQGKGQEWKFDTAQIANWLQDEAVGRAMGDVPDDMEQLKLREQKAKTVMAEMELAKAMKEVALTSEFERVQSKVFSIIRTNILNVPQRAVLQLLGEKDPTKFKMTLRAELVKALEAVADFEIDEDEDHQ